MEKEEMKALLGANITGQQRRCINAVLKEGSSGKAARVLGLDSSTVRQNLKSAVKTAARQDSQMHGVEGGHSIPTGYHIKGVSSYLEDESGARHWVKTDKDKEADLELAQELYSAMAEDVKRLKPLPAPKKCEKDLLTLYNLADCHLGMLAWSRESGGRSWDLKIAEEVIVDAMRRMIQRSDPASQCVIGQLGDWTHFDGLKPVTPESRHVLDADGRPAKIAETSVKIMRTVIDDCLRHHEKVHLIIAEGNHDEGSAVLYRVLYQNLYENEPRLTVDNEASPFYVHQHGKTMLGFHHGHKMPPQSLPGYFAAQHSKMWGECEYRYAHTGHRHHEEKTKDHGGMSVTQHPTLAARDSHASRHGYMAKSQAESVTYHKEHGQWSSVTITPKF